MKASIEFDLLDTAQATALATVLEVLHPGVFASLGAKTVTLQVGEVSMTGTVDELTRLGADPSAVFAASADPAAVFAAAPQPELPGDDAGDLDAGGDATAPAGSPPPPPAQAPATAPAGVQLDKAGLPWDARIHATVAGGGGKVNATDGLWRAKKGVSADLVKTVETELRAALSAAPAPPPAPVAPAAPPPPPPVADAPTVAPPGAPLPAATGAETPARQFASVMRDVTQLQSAGRLTADDVNATLTACGLETLRDLLVRPDLIPTFRATVEAFTRPEA